MDLAPVSTEASVVVTQSSAGTRLLLRRLARKHVEEAERMNELSKIIAHETLTSHAFERQFIALYFVQVALFIATALISLFAMHEIAVTVLVCVQAPMYVYVVFVWCCFAPGPVSARLLRLHCFTVLLVTLTLTVMHSLELTFLSRRLFVRWVLLSLSLLDTVIALFQLVGVVQLGRAWYFIHAIQNHARTHGMVDDKRE